MSIFIVSTASLLIAVVILLPIVDEEIYSPIKAFSADCGFAGKPNRDHLKERGMYNFHSVLLIIRCIF